MLETPLSTVMAKRALERTQSLADTGSCALLPLPPKQKQKETDAPAKLLPEPCGYTHM